MSILIDGFTIQRRILTALVIREVQAKYGRHNIGFLWIMAEPLMFSTGVMILWRLAHGEFQHSLPVVTFTFIGYMPMLLFRHMVGSVINCIKSNSGLLYHRQVSIFDIFLARAIPDIAGNLLAITFAFSVLMVFGFIDWPYDFGKVFFGYFLNLWFAVAVSGTMAALSDRSHLVEKIWTPASYLMIPICGAYLSAGWLQQPYRDYYLYYPTVSAYELMRSGYFGPGFTCYWDLPYLIGFNGITTLLALWLLYRARFFLSLE